MYIYRGSDVVLGGVVWLEGGREEEGVVPSNWITGNCLYWPNVYNATRHLKERHEPEKSWNKFKLEGAHESAYLRQVNF